MIRTYEIFSMVQSNGLAFPLLKLRVPCIVQLMSRSIVVINARQLLRMMSFFNGLLPTVTFSSRQNLKTSRSNRLAYKRERHTLNNYAAQSFVFLVPFDSEMLFLLAFYSKYPVL